MNFSSLNVRISILKNKIAVDEIGNRKSEWSDYFSCWATVSNEDSQKVQKSETAGLIIDHQTADFTVRCCNKVKAVNSLEYKVKFKDELYEILSVDHYGYKGEMVKIRCQKERPNGTQGKN